MQRAVASSPHIPGLAYERLLGSGGFSDVYLYRQELPRRQVAVKVLATEELTDASRAAFVAEANLMALLSAHPYIVTIYHADVAADGRPYFVMEYCSGPSLSDQYKRQSFTVADALRTGIRLSSAVATAHQAGILHRDIKPANVLTNDYGWPALTDFGISSAVDPDVPHAGHGDALGASESSPAGGMIGMSIPWSPPEMFADHPAPDVRSDVFSLAATIYTLLAGRTPFEIPGRPNGTVDLIGRIERGAITPLDRQDVPRSLVAVLQRGMAVDRSARFDTVLDFARSLQRVELGLSYSATPIDVPNLELDDRTSRQPEHDDDATRIRDVHTVIAQPRSLAGLQPSTIDRTQIAGPIVSPTQNPPPASQPEGSRPRGRRVLPILLGSVAIVAIAGMITAAVLFGNSPEELPPTTGEAITVSDVPSPERGKITISDDGTSVTFTWTNPEPEPGDRYIWQRTDGANDTKKLTTKDATATVNDISEGQNVCISVSISRGGKLSAEPLEVCTQ